jgi:uncharacterized protein
MFRPITDADLDAVLVLNAAHEVETGPLTREKLADMVATSFFSRTNDACTVLFTSFDQSSNYDSVNFRWFRDRYPRFIYIDRIIVAPAERGKGLARSLYLELFVEARVHGQDVIAAEVNRVPANPGSDAFHASLGFEEVGRGSPVPNKEVRYLMRWLHHA